MISHRIAITAILPLVLSAPAAGQAVPKQGRVASGTLSFDGHATVGDFTGTTAVVFGGLVSRGTLSSATGWVESLVRTLRTGNDRRDRDLNKSMESEQYPRMRFDLDTTVVEQVTSDSALVTLRGRFTIHGVEQVSSVPGVLTFGSEGLRLRATVPMDLRDYQIGGLSRMLGMLRMQPEIVVRVDLLFESSVRGDGPP